MERGQGRTLAILLVPIVLVGVALPMARPFMAIPFHEDDFTWLLEARHATGLLDWIRSPYFGFVRPTLIAYFRFGSVLFGTWESGYIALGVAAWLLAGVVLSAWLLWRGMRVVPVLMGALVFLLSAGHWATFSSACSAGDVLGVMFGVLAVLAFDGWWRAGGRGRGAFTVACVALALGSKETLVALPFALTVRVLAGPREMVASEAAWRRAWMMAGLAALLAVVMYVPETWWLRERLARQALPDVGAWGSPAMVSGYWQDVMLLLFGPASLDVRPDQVIGVQVAALLVLAVLWGLSRRGAAGGSGAGSESGSGRKEDCDSDVSSGSAVRSSSEAPVLATFGLAWLLLCLLPPSLSWPGHPVYLRYGCIAAPGLGILTCTALDAAWDRRGRRGWLVLVVAVGLSVVLMVPRLEFWRLSALAAAEVRPGPVLHRPFLERLPARVGAAPVYVYQRPDSEETVRPMVALALGRDRAGVMDLLDLLRGAPEAAWRNGSQALVLDARSGEFVDVTSAVAASQAEWRPLSAEVPRGRLFEQTVAVWEGSALRHWRPWQIASMRVGPEGAAFDVEQADAALVSPELKLDPLTLVAVEVEMALPPVPVAYVTQKLEWATEGQPWFDAGRSIEQRPFMTTPGRNGMVSTWLFPGEVGAWYTGGPIAHLRFVPSTTSGPVRIGRIRLVGVRR